MRYHDLAGVMRALLVMLVVFAPLAARADDVAVVVTGDHRMQSQVTAYVHHWLQRHGHKVAKGALNDDARTTLVNCMTIDDQACARGVVEARSAAREVVFARVDTTPGSPAVSFTTVWFIKGHDPLADKSACNPCDAKSWQPVADHALDTLHRSADEVTHTVHAAPPEPDPPPMNETPPEAGGSHVLPIAMFGVGVAGLAASGWFYYYGSKGGPGEKYIYPDANGWAIGTAAIGAGAIIAGVVLWRGAKSAPVATLGPGGGYVGWITRF